MTDKAREALKATHLIGLSQGEGESREAIAQALALRFIERAGRRLGTLGNWKCLADMPRSYSDDFYADADAILAALSGLSLPGRDDDLVRKARSALAFAASRSAITSADEQAIIAALSPPISGDASARRETLRKIITSTVCNFADPYEEALEELIEQIMALPLTTGDQSCRDGSASSVASGSTHIPAIVGETADSAADAITNSDRIAASIALGVFPAKCSDDETRAWLLSDGMPMRDYFAGQALANAAICTGTAPDYQLASWFGKYANHIMRDQIAAKQAYVYADAMLRARATPSESSPT